MDKPLTKALVHKPIFHYKMAENTGGRVRNPTLRSNPRSFNMILLFSQQGVNQFKKLNLMTDGYFPGEDIYIHVPERRVGGGARHQADGAGARTEKFGTGIEQYIAYRHLHPFGTPFCSGMLR